MESVLAVDGGNTKTIALVASLDGTVANIEYAVRSALQAAQIDTSDLVTGVFNMAGADWPEDFVYLRTAMEVRRYGATIHIQNDALGVLHAGSSDATGVSVVCGTGAATGARSPDGRIWHSSMWQNQVQGSAQLGQKTLHAVYRSELGIELPTTLTQRVLDFFHLESVEEVLHLFTSRAKRSPSRVDQLTPILLDEAQAGDSVASRVVQEHGIALGDYALAAARRVGIEGTAFTLVLAGGVFRHPSTVLEQAIIERVRSTSPDVRPTYCRFEPVIGVLFTALEAAGSVVDGTLLDKLIPTIPDPALFSTTIDYSIS